MAIGTLRRWALAALVVSAVALPVMPVAAQTPLPCSQFEAGSDEWIDCVQDLATGGGDIGDTADDPTGVCEEFTVGSPEWRECVKDAATGGGLMPWIVVIPIGVMVLVMFVVFGRRLLGRTPGRPFSASTMGRSAGGWLVFIGAIELAIGAGMAVAASQADGPGGGFFIAQWVLLGVGVSLVMIGLVVLRRSSRNARIESEGIPGTAKILSLTQTGMYLNEQPQIAMDLEVNVPGHPPFQTTHRSFVPLLLLGQLAAGGEVPVKADPADPTKRIIVDWQAGLVPQPGTTPVSVWQGSGQGSTAWLDNLSPEMRQTVTDALTRAGLQVADRPAERAASLPPATPPSRGMGGPGEPAEALAGIRAIQDTGVEVDAGKVMVLDLALLISGQGERKVRHAVTVPPKLAPRIAVGVTLPVRVDPNDPAQIDVDWDRF
jgi:hypothetical protein